MRSAVLIESINTAMSKFWIINEADAAKLMLNRSLKMNSTSFLCRFCSECTRRRESTQPAAQTQFVCRIERRPGTQMATGTPRISPAPCIQRITRTHVISDYINKSAKLKALSPQLHWLLRRDWTKLHECHQPMHQPQRTTAELRSLSKWVCFGPLCGAMKLSFIALPLVIFISIDSLGFRRDWNIL